MFTLTTFSLPSTTILAGKANVVKSPKVAKSASKSAAAKHKPPGGSGGGSGLKLNAGQENILKTMKKLRKVGHQQPTRDMVMKMSGNSKTPEMFKKNLGIMRKKFGYVEFPDAKTVALTARGVDYGGDDVDASSLSNESFQADIKEAFLSAKERLIFDALLDGRVHDKWAIAKALGYDLNKISGYEKSLSKMSSLGYLKKTKTQLQLTDDCYPLGRPNGTSLQI